MVQFIKTSEDGTMRALSGNRPSVWDSSQHTHTLKNTKHAAWYARNQKQEQDHIETTVAKTRYIAIYGASHCPCRLSFPMQSFWLSFFCLSCFSTSLRFLSSSCLTLRSLRSRYANRRRRRPSFDRSLRAPAPFPLLLGLQGFLLSLPLHGLHENEKLEIKVSHTVHGTYRRKFRSQTSDKMDRWKAEVESEKRREKKRREEKRREEKRREEKRREEKRRRRRRSGKRKSQKTDDAGARKGRKVAKHRVFTKICGSGGPKSRLATVAGAEPI